MNHDDQQQPLEELKAWASDALQAGWINQEDALSLDEIEQQHAEQLFKEGHQRPLIVALFGGTGVGKSSLLNRLANAPIARVGVERPTSHEVTLYLHQDYQLKPLPKEFPVEQISIRYHQDDRRRLIAWLDMPDIDSTATQNRDLVLSWLPYIDWLVYVVSPERYQDDIGWQFLQQRGHRHAWLFVMNHWDEGRSEQLDDFNDRLQNSGFSNPTILRTNCSDIHNSKNKDDFQRLESTINQALQTHGLEVLQQISQQARADDFKNHAARLREAVGSKKRWNTHQKQWQNRVEAQLSKLKTLLETQTNIVKQSLLLETSQQSLLSKKQNNPSFPPVSALTDALRTTRSDRLISDIAIELQNSLRQSNLPDRPFQAPLSHFTASAHQQLNESIETCITAALARPGTLLQRILYKFTVFLSGFLPLVAASWAIYHVVIGFYSGTQGIDTFLGVDFAIHSVLLIGLAWLIPWLLQRKLRPSLASAAGRGLHQGIHSGLEALNRSLQTLWSDISTEHETLLEALKKITDNNKTETKNKKQNRPKNFVSQEKKEALNK